MYNLKKVRSYEVKTYSYGCEVWFDGWFVTVEESHAELYAGESGALLAAGELLHHGGLLQAEAGEGALCGSFGGCAAV